MSQSQRESIQRGKQQTGSELYMDKINCRTSQIRVSNQKNWKTDILIVCFWLAIFVCVSYKWNIENYLK